MLKTISKSKSILTIAISAVIILLAILGSSWQKGFADTIPTIPIVYDYYEPQSICVNSLDTQVTVYGSNFINWYGDYYSIVRWQGPTNTEPIDILADEINEAGTVLKFTLTADLLTQVGEGTFWVVNHPDFGDPVEVGEPKIINIISCDIYLPLVMKNAQFIYPLLNGDFELGPDGSWDEYSKNGWNLILPTEGLPSSIPPHSGNWAVWLGGDYDETANISQKVTVYSSFPYFHFWYWIASQETCGYDNFYVKVNGIQTLQLDLCSDNNTEGWVEKVVDLSSYSGSTVTLMFEVTTTASTYSSFFLDDVNLSDISTVSSFGVGEIQLFDDITEVRTISR